MRHLLFAALLLAGCPGGKGATSGAEEVDPAFECNERQVGYVVSGGFAAAEAAVTVDCESGRPRLTRWMVNDAGEKTSRTKDIGSAAFDELWQSIEATGWRYLEEKCDESAASKTDPVYTIDVADYSGRKSFTCQGKELPFPYDRFITELDVRAAAL